MVALHFLDSSALVKRYVHESGTTWIQEMAVRHLDNRILVSRITWVEVLSALSRLRREKLIGRKSFDREVLVFQRHFRTEYQIVEVDQRVVELAGSLVQRHSLRAYDSVQLASAIKLRNSYSSARELEFRFVTSDTRLFMIAEVEGLHALDPSLQ